MIELTDEQKERVKLQTHDRDKEYSVAFHKIKGQIRMAIQSARIDSDWSKTHLIYEVDNVQIARAHILLIQHYIEVDLKRVCGRQSESYRISAMC